MQRFENLIVFKACFDSLLKNVKTLKFFKPISHCIFKSIDIVQEFSYDYTAVNSGGAVGQPHVRFSITFGVLLVMTS